MTDLITGVIALLSGATILGAMVVHVDALRERRLAQQERASAVRIRDAANRLYRQAIRASELHHREPLRPLPPHGVPSPFVIVRGGRA